MSWLRFSIREIFLVTLIVALLLTWESKRIRGSGRRRKSEP